MRLKPFNPEKELKKLNKKYTKKHLIISLLVLIVMISIGSSYAIFSINPQSYEIINSKVGEFSTGDIKLSVMVDGVSQSEFPAKGTGYVFDSVECENDSTGTWDANSWQLALAAKGPDKCIINFMKEKKLTELLLAQYQEGTNSGLVSDASNPNLYYYVGTNDEVANNFLWYGGHQWRVLEFDNSAKTITLISQQPLTSIQPANAVWTSASTYDSSYINQWLNDYFWNSLDSSIRENIKDTTFNVGVYTNVTQAKTTNKVGLLDYNQYLRAGGANSFLDIKDTWWLGNEYGQYSTIANIYTDGNVTMGILENGRGVRPVITINDIVINGGSGTLIDSYRDSNLVTNINEVQVGEYIDVPYTGSDNACGTDKVCTFRVINKGANGVKAILNGVLLDLNVWSNDISEENININQPIYVNSLSPFISNIPSNYINYGNFASGFYGDGSNYSAPQLQKIYSNVGLPTVGEMFSGNDIDLGEEKFFVDKNTIENLNVNSFLWTMNKKFDGPGSNVKGVSDVGVLGSFMRGEGAVRPTIYLKSDLIFTGGSGTAQDPYTLN